MENQSGGSSGPSNRWSSSGLPSMISTIFVLLVAPATSDTASRRVPKAFATAASAASVAFRRKPVVRPGRRVHRPSCRRPLVASNPAGP